MELTPATPIASPPANREPEKRNLAAEVTSAMGGATLGVGLGGGIIGAIIGALIGGIAANQANKIRR